MHEGGFPTPPKCVRENRYRWRWVPELPGLELLLLPEVPEPGVVVPLLELLPGVALERVVSVPLPVVPGMPPIVEMRWNSSRVILPSLSLSRRRKSSSGLFHMPVEVPVPVAPLSAELVPEVPVVPVVVPLVAGLPEVPEVPLELPADCASAAIGRSSASAAAAEVMDLRFVFIAREGSCRWDAGVSGPCPSGA